MENLHDKLRNITKIFDLKSILSANVDQTSIVKYYKINKWAYSLFHSRENLIHLGISRDRTYKSSDLLESVKFIEKYLKNVSSFKVLELATGRGANSKYLSSRFQNVQFTGIDISPTQLKFAKRVEKELPNYTAFLQDFHNLSKFKDETFDIVFEIESICYSIQKQKILDEVRRVLKKKGLFILIDGWLRNKRETYRKEEQLAFKLVEIGMSIKGSDTYRDFKEMARDRGFSIDFEENTTQFVLPTTDRHEKIARIFFKFPLIGKMATHFLPKEFVYNAITAYFWGDMMKKNITCYYFAVLKRN